MRKGEGKRRKGGGEGKEGRGEKEEQRGGERGKEITFDLICVDDLRLSCLQIQLETATATRSNRSRSPGCLISPQVRFVQASTVERRWPVRETVLL